MASLMKPKTFQRSSEGALANYDFRDVANGLGYVQYKTFTSQLSGASIVYNMSEFTPNVEGDTDEVVYIDSPFNITFKTSTFNLPQTIQGTAFINCTINCSGNNGALVVSILKNSEVLATVNAEVITTNIKTMVIPIVIPKTTIKRGDYLAVRFVGTADTNDLYLYFDALDRNVTGAAAVTASANPTEMLINIPFKVDL